MLRVFDTLFFTLERLLLYRVLVFWVLLGLSSATTLALSLVLYVDAVNTNLLSSQLGTPPYAVLFRYLGSWEGNISEDDVTSASAAIQEGYRAMFGLPTERQVRFVRSTPWRVSLMDEEGRPIPLRPTYIGLLEGSNDLINITAGEWPPQEPLEEGVIPALASETMLFTMGLQVGDRITAQQTGEPVTIEIVALWQPVNPNDPQWIFTPRFFNEMFIVPSDDFWNSLQGIEAPIEESAWYLIFDGTEVRTSDVPGLLSSMANGERDVANVLPGIRIVSSPQEGLRTFTSEVNRLTQQLVIIIAPVGGLVLYFVSLVAGLLVTRQQGQDVVLRSRGMSRGLLLSVHILMWLMLAGLSLAVAFALSPVIVQLVGRTTSFLRFDADSAPLEIVFTQQALLVGVGTALLAASSGLYMAWRSTRQNINSYKRASARASSAWWQRSYLDLMLLIPGFYVFYNLSREGGLQTEADDPFSDPLAFLGPTLFALGLTLLFLRVWPMVMRIGGGLIAYTSNISLLMALRELTRSIGRYRGTLLMMCFTLSLTGVTASMASTIDQSLSDTVDYRIGADAVIVTVVDAQTEEGEQTDDGQQTFTVTGFNTLPADDLLNIDGVEHVSRVGRYPARIGVRNQRVEGTILGVDRAALPAIVRFREDYSDLPQADLFNLLATNRSGVLISERTMIDQNLLIGQELTMEVQVLGEWYQTRAPILGVIEYFPTLDPMEGFFAITNIEPLFELVGTELPHDIWLDLAPDADLEEIKVAVRDMQFPVLEWRDPITALAEAQADPSRRGVLGFLSVGFVASILLTLVGAIIQNTASFRAQAIQLGSLRAMGLSGLASSAYLVFVQGIAAISGIASGTAIGVLTTLLFLPLLDFSIGLPPYLVRVAWEQIIVVYLIFAGVLLLVTLMTTLFASVQQLATVVKIGDA
ncbi:MAG: hypothetical protein OHK0046_24290 [Anaerolineae bacterium]